VTYNTSFSFGFSATANCGSSVILTLELVYDSQACALDALELGSVIDRFRHRDVCCDGVFERVWQVSSFKLG
jgi:hypothetical protein